MTAPGHTVIVGYGHAGRDLHHRCLRELTRAGELAAGVTLVVDPRPPAELAADTRWFATLDAALAALPRPAAAVFHVTTPVGEHPTVLTALLAAGATKVIMEKPVAHTSHQARELARAVRLAGATVVPVSLWPASMITARVLRLVAEGLVGVPRSVHMEQSKPRFRRSVADRTVAWGHRNAFEVELPHQMLLALHLADVLGAGPVDRILESSSWPMRLPDGALPTMGGAEVRMRHTGGLISTLLTDLTSPVRVRRLRVTGSHGAIVADYPISSDDDFGQIWVTGERERQVIADAPLTTFLGQAHRHLAGAGPAPACGLDSHVTAIELIEHAVLSANLSTSQEVVSC